MAVLEANAAATPVGLSVGPSLLELWGESAIVLPRPSDSGQWYSTVDDLLSDPIRWKRQSRIGLERAKHFDWTLVAGRYLAALE